MALPSAPSGPVPSPDRLTMARAAFRDAQQTLSVARVELLEAAARATSLSSG